jgi:hypothetical protein
MIYAFLEGVSQTTVRKPGRSLFKKIGILQSQAGLDQEHWRYRL